MRLLVLLFLYAFNSIAYEANVVVRNKRNRAKILKRSLPNLISTTHFEGKFFKIVLDKSNDPISFNSDKDLKLRAATTYYHLNIARDYFVNELKSDYVKEMKQITIRLEIKNVFNNIGHFSNDNKDPEFNNAVTVPPGDGYEPRGIKPWGYEIWFRPEKRIHRDEVFFHSTDATYKGMLKSYRNQAHMTSFTRFLVDSLSMSPTILTPNVDAGSIIRVFGASIFLELSYHLFDDINRVFSRRFYSLDSALVPEIIYHEFAHIALSDNLYPSHSTPVIEGMADFFAGKIANSPVLAKKIKKYNTFNGKNAKNKKLFTLQFETENYANTDFVFGMLWSLDTVLGKENSPNFVYKLREKLETNNSIRNQFIEGILDTCRTECSNSYLDQMKMLKFFHTKGI